jgi:DNA invertase Pin-like site-specific DNA recombinase
MKIAIYSRKSKYTGIGDSIENQIQMCKDYAANKYNNTKLDFDIYEDEGFSGGNINRPKFQELIRNIKKYDVLICYRLDRISRNVADFSSTLSLLQANNCDFVSIREQFDTSSPMGRAMIYIASVFAQLERETIAERVRDNMMEMAKHGSWTGGRTPLGYDSESSTYVDDEGNERKIVKLVKNEEELKLVNLIYDTYLKEGSLHKTEVWFTQHNIKSNGGILLEKTSLKVILQNPVYVKSTPEVLEYLKNTGWNVYGTPDGFHSLLSYNKTESVTVNGKTAKKVKPKSEWVAAMSNVEGVIDAETWLNVQKQFDKNRDTFPRLGKTNNAILTGKLKCALCKSNMRVSHGTASKSGEKFYYYV